jgi:ABC-2 type transport system ATP-binding protein
VWSPLLGLAPTPPNPELLPRIGVQLPVTSFVERLAAREQLRAFAGLYGVDDARIDETLAVGLTEKPDGASVRR